MADKKISQLTPATTPLDGTEVLPIVQSGSTVKVANNDLRPKQIQSNATSGVLQVAGPTAGTTRVMTTPDANFTAARIDAGQTFTGTQAFSNAATFSTSSGNVNIGTSGDTGSGKLVIVDSAKNQLCVYGYSSTGGSNNPSGQIQLGNQSYNGQIQYNGSTGQLNIDNTYNADTGNIYLRTKTSGTALYALTVFGSSGVSIGGVTDPGAGNLRVNTGNLVIGTSGKGISLPGGITWTSGSGSPESVVTAPVGSLYSCTNGGAGTSLYVKESGSGNTGWVGK